MLTKVYLDGVMGEEFGSEWEFEISTPIEAIKMVDANKPGFSNWIRRNAGKYTHYQIIVEYDSGDVEHLSEERYAGYTSIKRGKMIAIRFVPVIVGSGKWTNAIVGAVIVVWGLYSGDYKLAAQGAIMLVSGVVSALLTPSRNARLSTSTAESKSLVSEAFDGPSNTTHQGVPIPLIYGRILVGSSIISAGLVVV